MICRSRRNKTRTRAYIQAAIAVVAMSSPLSAEEDDVCGSVLLFLEAVCM